MPAKKINKVNFVYFFGVSFASLLSVFVFTMAAFNVVGPTSTTVKNQPTVYLQTSEPAVTKKVLVLDFNPTLTSQSNKKLTEYKGWNNPRLQEAVYMEDVRNNSGGFVNYQLVEHIEINDFPIKNDGFDYNETTYLNCLNNNVNCHSSDLINYKKILDDYDVCEKRNNGEIDELWIWGGPYFGFYGATLAGPNLFGYGSDPIYDTVCTKQLPIMGFNYDSDSAEMLKRLGYRAQAVLTKAYGSWEKGKDNQNWNKYTIADKDWSGRGVCGYVNYPPNAESESQYDNQRFVDSTCDNWFNYPDLSGTKQSVNCSTWGCNNYGFQKWWLNHLPRFDGITSDNLNNWWRYILNYDEAVDYWSNRRCMVPGVPNNVKAVSGPDSGQITLSWDKSSNAKYYSISYGATSLNYTWGAANVGDVNTYVVRELEPGKPYYFLVMAHNDCGSSGALQEVAAYAGKGQTTYWVAPEVVYLPLDKLPSASESAKATTSASLEPISNPLVTSSPSAKAKFAINLPKLPQIGNGLKIFGIGLLILAVLAFVGKRIIEKETVESSIPPASSDQFPATSNQQTEIPSWPPPEAINVSDEQMADQLPPEEEEIAKSTEQSAQSNEYAPTNNQYPADNNQNNQSSSSPEPLV